ncbi:hypothetical protein [uncultured Campylobacter sp.]|uniref:hypothetical protein n=1 Tax=uncultured Campylobacter sp. TaxID=218934 RepID=UPI00262E9FEF|nr:hypothetical protein [uncultured Campylobacter sp.]
MMTQTAALWRRYVTCMVEIIYERFEYAIEQGSKILLQNFSSMSDLTELGERILRCKRLCL